jgi:hypothetical protein
MKRMVIISLLAMFTVMQVQAQQIKLEYENKIDSLPELMVNFQF